MTLPNIFFLLFWLSAGVVAYTFVGYPALIHFLARLRHRATSKMEESNPPMVSIVLVAYNEAARISSRLENFFASRFASEKLEVVLVSDGSNDGTVEAIPGALKSRVHLIVQPTRSGKAAGLNQAIAAAKGDLIVFADARQRFAPDAISRLVSCFADPSVGAVSGSYETDASSSSVGGGVDLYWQLEKRIRRAESQIDSSIGCTGAIYAIRKSLFQQIPPDSILDDVIIPMQIVTQGYRVIFEPEARCFDPQANEPAVEKRRKQRTLAGNFQMLFRYPQWLFPWKNRLWWQLISHKYLRIIAPLFLGLMLISNVVFMETPMGRLLLSGQCVFYALAALGAFCPGLKIRVFSIPAAFCFLNLMTIGGLWNYVRGSYRSGWR